MCFFTCTIVFVALIFFISSTLKKRQQGQKLIGFLHPASGGGGGGERVLWIAIERILSSPSQSNTHVALYTSEFPAAPSSSNSSSSTEYLLSTLVPKQFGIQLTPQQRARLHVRYIRWQNLQDPNLYPVARLLLQSFVGGLALALGVLHNIFFVDTTAQVPTLLIDSVGIPFSYIWLRLAFASTPLCIGCYVHYPYISTDMIDSVASERVMPNNPQPAVGLKKQLKLAYYQAMVLLYRYAAGALVNGPVACNSTWTRDHIRRVWGPVLGEARIALLFPPVNAERFKQFDLEQRFLAAQSQDGRNINNKGEILLISVGQFRPEKDHPLLLRSFSRALKTLSESAGGGLSSSTENIKLKVIGGARNEEDKQRAENLKLLVPTLEMLSLGTNVEFCLNVPFTELEDAFRAASVGLHTMRDEHFGIVVVEYMASGCITIANNSAGPAEIVRNGVDGFLCATEEEYAAAIVNVVTKIRSRELGSLRRIQELARESSGKYGDAGFGENFEKMFGK
jgi:alpha-1,2-mannosyltransferase